MRAANQREKGKAHGRGNLRWKYGSLIGDPGALQFILNPDVANSKALARNAAAPGQTSGNVLTWALYAQDLTMCRRTSGRPDRPGLAR